MKKILIFLLVVSLLIVLPVSAETIEYTYTDSSSHDIGSGGTNGCNFLVDSLMFKDISKYGGFRAYVLGINRAFYGSYPDWISKSTDVTYSIGGTYVGSGSLTITNVFNDNGVAYRSILTIETYDWDVSGYSGQCFVDITDSSSLDFFGAQYLQCTQWAEPPFNVPDGFGYAVSLASHANGYPTVGKGFEATAYNNANFYQKLVYSVGNDILSLNYDRNGIGNLIKIVDGSGGIIYNSRLVDNFDLMLYDYPVWVNVTNPYNAASWSNLIPETAGSTLPPEQTALLHAHVYDAVTRELIGNGHTVSVHYAGASLPNTCSWPGSVSHTTLDWSDAASANVTYSADGYESVTNAWSKFYSVDPASPTCQIKVGEEKETYVYLPPTGTPSNTTAYVTFEVQEQVTASQFDNYFYSSGAAVTVGNTTLTTGGLGTCTFELPAGTYSYTVRKTGYQTTSGTFSLGSSNQYIGVDLPLMPGAPTPTGQAGVDYPYSEVDPREKAEQTMGILFDALPMWAGLAVIVVTFSFIGWMKPKR